MMANENAPRLWQDRLPVPEPDGHKYDRGHVLVLGAESLSGATALATSAASRIGAGLVSVVAEGNGDLYRAILPFDIMVREEMPQSLKRVSTVLAGPGGITEMQRTILTALPGNIGKILDANAIPQDGDFSALDERTILTPHEGEFAEAFAGLEGSKPERALAAAQATGAVVVVKGMETIIAAADGRVVVNRHASPWLAKAGTGDVLAGMIAGLHAQGMEAFDAACAAVWMHGEAGQRIGPGLTAVDLDRVLPSILQRFLVPGDQSS